MVDRAGIKDEEMRSKLRFLAKLMRQFDIMYTVKSTQALRTHTGFATEADDDADFWQGVSVVPNFLPDVPPDYADYLWVTANARVYGLAFCSEGLGQVWRALLVRLGASFIVMATWQHGVYLRVLDQTARVLRTPAADGGEEIQVQLLSTDASRAQLAMESLGTVVRSLVKERLQDAPLTLHGLCPKCLASGKDAHRFSHSQVPQAGRAALLTCERTDPPANVFNAEDLLFAQGTAPDQRAREHAAYAFDVFVSYGRSPVHEPFARALADCLEARGYRVWIDMKRLQPGEQWVVAIGRGLQQSRILVPILTEKYMGSMFCMNEFYTFVADRKAVRPVRFTDTSERHLQRLNLGASYFLQDARFTEHPAATLAGPRDMDALVDALQLPPPATAAPQDTQARQAGGAVLVVGAPALQQHADVQALAQRLAAHTRITVQWDFSAAADLGSAHTAVLLFRAEEVRWEGYPAFLERLRRAHREDATVFSLLLLDSPSDDATLAARKGMLGNAPYAHAISDRNYTFLRSGDWGMLDRFVETVVSSAASDPANKNVTVKYENNDDAEALRRELSELGQQLADKDQQLAELGQQLAQQGQQLAEQGQQLVEQDHLILNLQRANVEMLHERKSFFTSGF